LDISRFDGVILRHSLKFGVTAFAVGGLFCTFLACLAAANEPPVCNLTALPAQLKRHIQTNFRSWRPQNASDLSADAKMRWQSEKPLDCPGIAIGQFENKNEKSYSILLVPASNSDTGYRLLVFTPGNQGHFRIVEKSDEIGASNFFIHQTRLAKAFGPEWAKKIQINTSDGILFVDSGKSEYEADVYFWTGSQYRHEPIDY
jgi:hypothetical protein